MRIYDVIEFCYLTLAFFLQCYKPHYNSLKIAFDLSVIKAIDLHNVIG